MIIAFDTVVPFFWFYSWKKAEIVLHTWKAHSEFYIVLFIFVKTWKQSEYPLKEN